MHVKKDPPSDNLAQTWLVRPRPSSQAFLNTLRKKQGESLHSSANVVDIATVTSKDYGTPADTPVARARSSRRSVLDLGRPGSHFMKGKIVNKSSFTKPTFKWMRGELIGKGSYGRVYLALNATTGEVMAVKQVELPRIAKDLRHSEQLDVVRALRSESDTLRDLDHPNIVQYLGYEENADCLSIFLEYVPGGTIASCLRKYGKFDENISKSFTAQILNGLEYLHSKQILHRDLKSDNILVEISGACKISDFGISKKAEGRAFTGMKGTVYWMAPEVLDSEGKGYDAKVDIWSIGCILQEMWTGKRPWCGEELVAVMMKLVFDKKPPPLPSGMKRSLSPNALDFLELCFQPDPTRRPSAALLKKHPYLALPANWVFPAFDEARYTFSLARLNSLRNPEKDAENGRNYDMYDVPTPRPDQTKYPGRRTDLQTVKRGPSPPLVIITPPGSPKKNSAPTDWVLGKQSPYTASESSESRSRTSRSSRSRRKTYRITNPDCDSDNEESHRNKEYGPAFSYNPPPLPELGPPVPYSSALDAPSTLTTSTSHHSLNSYLERIGRRRTVRQSQTMAARSKSQLARLAKEFEDLPEHTGNSDSDPETTTGGSMWMKPPADLVPVRYKEPRTPVEDRLSRLTARLSLSDRHGESWAPRPDIEDVVQHLEEFFPDHNLDQEVAEGGSRIPGLSLSRTGVARGKSIRKIAEEQVNRQQTDPKVLRRRTQLWDSRLQELK